jgi:EpsI family protein
MEKISVRYMVVLFLFAACGVLCAKFGYGVGRNDHGIIASNHMEMFPLKFQQWHGERQPLEENIYRILGTQSVLVNLYANGEERVYFTVVYYPEAKVEFHAPEACNSALGDEVLDMGTREVVVDVRHKTIPVKVNVFSVAKSNGERFLYYYFFKTGDLVGNSYLDLRIRMAMNTFRARGTGGAMLVLSTPMVGNTGIAMGILNRFLGVVYPDILKYV